MVYRVLTWYDYGQLCINLPHWLSTAWINHNLFQSCQHTRLFNIHLRWISDGWWATPVHKHETPREQSFKRSKSVYYISQSFYLCSFKIIGEVGDKLARGLTITALHKWNMHLSRKFTWHNCCFSIAELKSYQPSLSQEKKKNYQYEIDASIPNVFLLLLYLFWVTVQWCYPDECAEHNKMTLPWLCYSLTPYHHKQETHLPRTASWDLLFFPPSTTHSSVASAEWS